MPEPIFSETVTDLDGADAGELEVEGNGSMFRSRVGGGYAFDTSLQVEWLATRHLGLRLEPTFAASRDSGTLTKSVDVGVSGGISWKLLQAFKEDFHLQAEVLGRLPWDESPIVEPGDPALPLAVDLRAGARTGPLTLRWGLGYGIAGGGAEAAHFPIRVSAAVLTPFESSGRFGFFGVELDVDGARTAPPVAALNFVPNLEPAGIPFSLGFALPWAIGERDDRPSLGIFVRLFYESAREIEFAEKGSR
jgi:hypothetical protein